MLQGMNSNIRIISLWQAVEAARVATAAKKVEKAAEQDTAPKKGKGKGKGKKAKAKASAAAEPVDLELEGPPAAAEPAGSLPPEKSEGDPEFWSRIEAPLEF